MVLNYLKLSLRLLIRNSFLSLINITGLAIGFSVFFILSQYALNELGSDRFHEGWKQIVRLNFQVEKNKEIGIRKILGAQAYQIAGVLLGSTLRQISFSIIIGMPLAYYLTDQYRANFIERMPVQWWHYVLPLLILGGILTACILFVVTKATRANPIESLRYE